MLRPAAVAAAFAALYFLTTKLTGWLIDDPAALWPASGLYLGVMLVAPRRMWSALAVAAFAGSLATYLDGGATLGLSVAFAVPSSAEGLLAAVLVERIAGTRFKLAGVRDLRALVMGAAVANGLVALSAAAVAAQSFDASFGESWLRWWSADTLGMIAVAPILTAARRELRATAVAALGVALVAAHVGSDVYAVQGFVAVLLTASLGLAAAAGEGERLRDALGRSTEESERRRKAADHASHKLEGSAERLERAGRRIAQLTADLAARSAEVHAATRHKERLAADLRDSEAARERTERELADARSELADARSELADARRDLAGARSELADARSELSRTSRETDALEEELAHAGTQNRALEEALSRAGDRNDAVEEELARVTRENGALEDELARARTACGALQREIDRRQSEEARISEELERAEAERRRVEEELAAGRREDVRSELEELHRAHAETRQALEQARALLLHERRQREQALDEITATLARTEAERRLLADHATELIARYDDRGTCLYASPASRRLLGYEPEELAGRAGADLLHPDDGHLLARARATRSETTFQARLRRKDGAYVWVEVLLRPVLARDGDRPVAITATIRATSRDRDLAAA